MPDAMGAGLIDDDPDGGPTVLLGEAPAITDRSSGAPALDNEAWREIALSLVSLNEKTAATVDFPQSALEDPSGLEVSCGRGEDNQVVLQDPRVSVRHFTLHVRLGSGKAGAIELELMDESSNGTWVNDQPVGKGQTMSLVTGDRVFVLPSARVGTQAAIGYVVVALPPKSEVSKLRRAQQLGLAPPIYVPTPCRAGHASNADNGPDSARQLASHVQCRCCSDALIHRCATTVPCGHNFCLGCIISWSAEQQSSGKFWPDCPVCSAPIRQLVRNHSVDGIIETFLRAHPEAKRPDANLQELDAIESDPANAITMARLLHGKHALAPRPGARNSHAGVPLNSRSAAAQRGAARAMQQAANAERRATQAHSSACAVS